MVAAGDRTCRSSSPIKILRVKRLPRRGYVVFDGQQEAGAPWKDLGWRVLHCLKDVETGKEQQFQWVSLPDDALEVFVTIQSDEEAQAEGAFLYDQYWFAAARTQATRGRLPSLIKSFLFFVIVPILGIAASLATVVYLDVLHPRPSGGEPRSGSESPSRQSGSELGPIADKHLRSLAKENKEMLAALVRYLDQDFFVPKRPVYDEKKVLKLTTAYPPPENVADSLKDKYLNNTEVEKLVSVLRAVMALADAKDEATGPVESSSASGPGSSSQPSPGKEKQE